MPRKVKSSTISDSELVDNSDVVTLDRLNGLPRSNYFDDAMEMSKAIQGAAQQTRDRALSRLVKPK